MSITRFEDLIAWQKSQKLAIEVYKNFNTIKDFGFRDQIQRAAISISNNIAEGFERSTKKDFKRFLYIAIGSASELKSMLYLTVELNYLPAESSLKLIERTNEVSRIIRGLIKTLKT